MSGETFRWRVDSPEVQAAAIIAALEHMKQFPPEYHEKDVGHYKSMWLQSLEARASDVLRAFGNEQADR